MSFHSQIRDYIAQGLTLQGNPVAAFVGDPPENTVLPYCFVQARLPVQASADVASETREVSERVRVTVAAQSTINALALAERLVILLEGFSPTVHGWHSSPLRHVGATDIQVDRSTVIQGTNMHPAWCVLEFLLDATKEEA